MKDDPRSNAAELRRSSWKDLRNAVLIALLAHTVVPLVGIVYRKTHQGIRTVR